MKRQVWLALFLFLLFIGSFSCGNDFSDAPEVENCLLCPSGSNAADDDPPADDDDATDDDEADDDATDDDAADDDATDDDATDDDDDTVDPITLDLVEGCNPFMTSDECALPYPSAFFQIADAQSPTGVRMNYSEDMLEIPEGMPEIDMGPTNTADGVSPAGPILLHFEADIHENFLSGQREIEQSLAPGNAIALFDYETGKRVMFMAEMDMNRKEAYPGRYALIIRPLEPMEMGHRHVVAMTNELTDTDDNPLTSPEAFAVLRDNILTTNQIIEDVRDHYENIFAFLETKGYARSSLLLAWDFMVASDDYLLGSVLSMREEALAEIQGKSLGYTISSIQTDPNQYMYKIVQGVFEVPSFLQDDNSILYDEDHHPIRREENQEFPFTMLIPKMAQTAGGPIPLVVFGHGLFGSGSSYLVGWGASLFHPLVEQAGVVMVATDWIGLSSGDLELIINEVIQDLNRISIVTDRLQQSLINNLVLTETAISGLSTDPDVWVADHPLIDEDKIYYYGVSLGGIQGSSFLSISNRITRGVAAVPGSVWLNMIPRSTNWPPIKLYLDLFYPDPLMQQIGIAIFQSRFDLSDPINLTRLMFRDPPPQAPENRSILLQESIDDCQVPNLTTEMLARAIGVPILTPSIFDVYGLDTIASPTNESVLVQYYLTEQAQANPPPQSNVPPAVDNGVHSDMCFMEHVLDQVFHFVETGEIIQYCEGACDPD